MDLRIAAMKRLRTIVEPILEARHNKGLTLSEIGEPARQALAVYLLTGALDPSNGISPLIYDVMPEYIERFDECVLTGGNYEQGGKKMKKLIMGVVDSRMNGGVRPVLGVYDVEDNQIIKGENQN